MSPWNTKFLLRSINKKNKLYYRYKSTGTDDARSKYSTFRNTLTSVLRQAKNNYFCSSFQAHRKDTKSTWKIINDVKKKR